MAEVLCALLSALGACVAHTLHEQRVTVPPKTGTRYLKAYVFTLLLGRYIHCFPNRWSADVPNVLLSGFTIHYERIIVDMFYKGNNNLRFLCNFPTFDRFDVLR